MIKIKAVGLKRKTGIVTDSELFLFISTIETYRIFKTFAAIVRGIHLFRRILNGKYVLLESSLVHTCMVFKIKEQKGYDSEPMDMLIANTLGKDD